MELLRLPTHVIVGLGLNQTFERKGQFKLRHRFLTEELRGGRKDSNFFIDPLLGTQNFADLALNESAVGAGEMGVRLGTSQKICFGIFKNKGDLLLRLSDEVHRQEPTGTIGADGEGAKVHAA